MKTTAHVSFVFTNPRHHLEMMLPVARELERRSISCRMISVAELRGLETPTVEGRTIHRAIPLNIRRRPSAFATSSRPGGVSARRRLAQRLISMLLIPRLRQLIGTSRVVVIPNDWVFPFNDLLAQIGGTTPIVLMQEGIRMTTPNHDAYGTGPLAALCAWGEGSAEFFRTRGVAPEVIAVTGAPRLDALDPSSWHARGEELLARLGLPRRPLSFLSNPIEIQGYGTNEDKLALFERFLEEVAPVLEQRDLHLLVKNHLHEDPAEFAAIATRTPIGKRVHVLPDVPLFSVLAASAAGVVLTSTVGLEALMFDVPIAALEIPGHGFGFEYVERGAAVGLRCGAIGEGVSELLDSGARREAGRAFVARHLHDRGQATARVADQITRWAR